MAADCLHMVQVVDRAVVDAAEPDATALLDVLRAARSEGCYIYSFYESAPKTACTRFFDPAVGLWEDAATGIAAGPLCTFPGQAKNRARWHADR